MPLSIILPTIGRPTLPQALATVGELEDGDELIVVGDTLDGRVEFAELETGLHGGTYIPHAGPDHNWGNHQFNRGLEEAREGNHIVPFSDDDGLAPGGLDALREAIRTQPRPRPIMMQFQHIQPSGWVEILDGREIVPGRVSGANFITPKLPGKLPMVDPEHGPLSDYHWIRKTLDLWPPGCVEYVPVVLIKMRPWA